jgi:hypothetical protein
LRYDTRRYKRYRIPLPIRFSLISGEDRRRFTRFFQTKLWDIGLGGLSLITPSLRLDGIHFIYDSVPTVRNQIMMQIQLPTEETPLTALGFAVRAKAVKVNQRQYYLMGIHFLQISESHGARLRSFIERVRMVKPETEVKDS